MDRLLALRANTRQQSCPALLQSLQGVGFILSGHSIRALLIILAFCR